MLCCLHAKAGKQLAAVGLTPHPLPMRGDGSTDRREPVFATHEEPWQRLTLGMQPLS